VEQRHLFSRDTTRENGPSSSSNSSSMGGSAGSRSNSGNENDSGGDGSGDAAASSNLSNSLCASCDRCRARKSRCDGKRPCMACKAKYMKKNKLSSCEGIPPEMFQCVYSPAKKRGPVPGHKLKKSDTANAAAAAVKEAMHYSHSGSKKPAARSSPPVAAAQGAAGIPVAATGQAGYTGLPGMPNFAAPYTAPLCGQIPLLSPLDPNAAAYQQQILSSLGAIGLGLYASYAAGGVGGIPGIAAGSGGTDAMANNHDAAKQQLAYIQQLQRMHQQAQANQEDQKPAASSTTETTTTATHTDSATATSSAGSRSPGPSGNTNDEYENKGIAVGCQNPSVLKLLHLLEPTDPDAIRFNACYALSFGSLFGLPPIPSNEEYCRRLPESSEPNLLPKFDVAALQATRFAELGMGALANGQRSMVLELANASVLCLRECVEESIHPSCMFDVARTFFFHGIFRAYFGDMERYFKYRRFSLRHLAQLDGTPGVEMLMAAISFQDSLAYLIHNATEGELPDIDDEIPRVGPPPDLEGFKKEDETSEKYGISSAPSMVASNPLNQMWIQGVPPVFINLSAPSKSRVIDALACSIRSSLDNSRSIRKSSDATQEGDRRKRKYVTDTSSIPPEAEAKGKTATETAVQNNYEELSPRNLLNEASSLLQSYEENSPSLHNILSGHHLLVSALDVIFSINADDPGELDDSQIQNLITVLKAIIERPIMLFQGGPTYHIMNNCTIITAHFLNKLYSEGINFESAKALFEEVLDIYNGARMVLNSHRTKLPPQLRCVEIPRPNLTANSKNREPVFDFGKTPLGSCRTWQSRVLPESISPDVVKRVRVRAKSSSEDTKSSASSSTNEYERYRSELEREFDVDDKALLLVLSRIITPSTRK